MEYFLRRVPPGQKQDLGAVRVDGRGGFLPKNFECKEVEAASNPSVDVGVVRMHARHTLSSRLTAVAARDEVVALCACVIELHRRSRCLFLLHTTRL